MRIYQVFLIETDRIFINQQKNDLRQTEAIDYELIPEG